MTDTDDAKKLAAENEMRWIEEVEEVLGPYWSQHPDMTLEAVLIAVANQGDPRAIAMRDRHLGRIQ
jgi:hypothetical protein